MASEPEIPLPEEPPPPWPDGVDRRPVEIVPLPDMPASWPMDQDDPRAGQLCECAAKFGCSGLRGKHRGRLGTLGCLDHATFNGASVPCPCPVFHRDRTRERALELADEHPRVAIALWDAARPRSKKTALARAEGTFGVGPSDVGVCRKQIEYRERPPDDYTPDEVDRSAAYLGTMIDVGFKQARRRRYPWREFDVPVWIVGIPKPGSADEVDRILGRLTEEKSCGERKWEMVGKYGPDLDWWRQADLYGLGLNDSGTLIREVEILTVRRSTGECEMFRRPWSRENAMQALARLHAVLDALEAGVPLPRDREGPTLDKICASYCPAVRHCWGLDSVPAGRTPEGWLAVHDDETVAGLLAEYDDAREGKKPAETVQERIKVLVEGVEPGRYGGMTLRWTGGRCEWVPDQEAWTARLEAELERLAPGLLASLERPERQVTTTRRIEIKRVRRATLDAEQAEQEQGEASA